MLVGEWVTAAMRGPVGVTIFRVSVHPAVLFILLSCVVMKEVFPSVTSKVLVQLSHLCRVTFFFFFRSDERDGSARLCFFHGGIVSQVTGSSLQVGAKEDGGFT